ncbi:hypothetical protein Tco_0497124 [Tanacetum coccineum]
MNDSMIELRETFQAWLQQRQEQVVNLDSYTPEPSQYQKIPIYYDDDDDEESSIPLRDIINSGLPPCIAITPVLTTNLAENLVPTPSESEDASDDVCDLPVCDDFPKSYLVSFSNPLFDIDDDCTSSDDESFFEEDFPIENFKFFSNPLFDLDEEIVSTEVNLIQNEVLESITSIPLGIDSFYAESNIIESLLNQNTLIDSSSKIDSLLNEFAVERLLYDNSSPRLPEELNVENSIESFSPSPILVKDSDSLMEEIDVFLASDGSIPPGIENDDYDSEGDILFLEELLSNNSLSLHETESFHFDHFDVPSSPRPPAKPPDDGIYFEPNTGLFNAKVVGDISEHYVLMPRLLPTQPTLCLVIDTLLPFSSKNEDKAQDSVNKNNALRGWQPMLILSNIMIASDVEVSRAHGFCPSFTRASNPQLHYGNPISNLID